MVQTLFRVFVTFLFLSVLVNFMGNWAFVKYSKVKQSKREFV